jgi:hypothetical protein
MTKSTKVPKGWEGPIAALTGLADRFCNEHLDLEYADKARYAIAELCRKRPSPLTSVISRPGPAPCFMRWAGSGIAPSTGGNKAKLVRKALSMHPFDHNWMLPSRLASSSLARLIEVDGLVLDARQLPVAIQAVAVQKGLIPFAYPPLGQALVEPA